MNIKIGLACDHAGFDYKEKVVKHLKEKGYTVNDYGFWIRNKTYV